MGQLGCFVEARVVVAFVCCFTVSALFWHFPVYSQTAPVPPPQVAVPSATTTNAPPSTIAFRFIEGLIEALVKPENIAALSSILLGLVGVFWYRTKNKLRRYVRRFAGPRFSLPAESVEYQNRVLQVGIGGTGKTTLIKSLTAHPDADPRVSTNEVRTYSIVKELTTNRVQQVCRIDIDDYRGQNIGQLVDQWGKRKSENCNTAIHSVVFLVDLFPPAPSNEEASRQYQFNDERISQHLKEWSESAILSILSLSEIKPNYVCLFVNKIDLLENRSIKSTIDAKDKYGELVDLLSQLTRGALFEVKVGSAETGEGVPDLLRNFCARAERIES